MSDELEKLARSIYAELSAKQTPMPEDIAAAVYGNLSSLYATDEEMALAAEAQRRLDGRKDEDPEHWARALGAKIGAYRD